MPKKIRKHSMLFKTAVLLIADVFCFAVACWLSCVLTAPQINFFSTAFWSVYGLVFFVDVIVNTLLFFTFRLYAASLKSFGLSDTLRIIACVLIQLLVNVLVMLMFTRGSLDYYVMVAIVYFVLVLCSRFCQRVIIYLKKVINSETVGTPTMIIGAGDAGLSLVKDIKTSEKFNLSVKCFIDDDLTKKNMTIDGVAVVGTTDEIEHFVKLYNVELIVIAIPSISKKDLNRLYEKCRSTGCDIRTVPGVFQILTGKVTVSSLRKIEINDLLGREEVRVNLDDILNYIEKKTVLVTGGGGSIGSELCRQIAMHNPKQLIIFDIYENNAYDIEQELKFKYPKLNLLTLIGSVRDTVKLDDLFSTYRPDIVFHAAAHKHVPLMETSPNEAVKNNVLGTYKVCKAADKYGAKRFIMISTDKAVNPTNIMGATKRICEMIIQAMDRKSKTEFVAVRFGNVLGSNGSVIPLFQKQIEAGGPVTVTDRDIVRYFMTIPEAVALVLQAGAYAKGGEIFVLDMGEPVRIYDLAEKMIRLSGYTPNVDIDIEIIGLRPGEKLFEERLMQEEGLEKTQNRLISIGKPLEMDDVKLFKKLDVLYNEAYSETNHMKRIVAELVPTYKFVDEPPKKKAKAATVADAPEFVPETVAPQTVVSPTIAPQTADDSGAAQKQL